MTEQEFLRRVIDLAKMTGWRVAHFRPAMTAKGGWITRMDGHYGFPDLVLVRPPRLLFAELKVGKNKVTTEQQEWLAALGRCRYDPMEDVATPIEVFEWRPEQWYGIVKILR